MTARFLIASLISASIIQTAFLSPVFGKTPAPTADVAVEVRIIRIGSQAFERFTANNQDVDSQYRKALLASSVPGGSRLNDKEVHYLLENLQGDRNSGIMQAPRITVPDGRSGTCQITDTQYFVTDVVRVKSTQNQLMDIPKNEAFETGLKVFVQPKVSKDGQIVRLHLKVRDKSLDGPVPLFPVTTMITPIFEGGAEGKPVPFTQYLQQPSFTSHILDKRLSIPDGDTVLLEGWTRTDTKVKERGMAFSRHLPLIGGFFKEAVPVHEVSHIYLMVTAHVIVPEERNHRVFKSTAFAPTRRHEREPIETPHSREGCAPGIPPAEAAGPAPCPRTAAHDESPRSVGEARLPGERQ